MRPLYLLVLVALVLTGCRSPTGQVAGSLIGVTVGGAAFVGLTRPDCDCETAGDVALASTLALAVIWIIGEVSYDPEGDRLEEETERAAVREQERARALAPPPPPVPPLSEPIAAREPQARQLTIQAHRAAHRGDCATVVALEPRIRSLDPAYHQHVFRADPPIAACFR